MVDPYAFSDSDVLRNLFDLRDQKELDALEADFTSTRLAELISDESPCKTFGFEGLCEVHRYIFQDIYDWAGKPRTVPIEKYEPVLGGISVEYSRPENIERDTRKILATMESFEWSSLSRDEVAVKFAEFVAKLWKVHPFREGNTRTIVTFCEKYIIAKGFELDVSVLEENAAFLRNALVAATAIFTDLGDRRNPEYLQKIIGDALGTRQK